MLQTRWASLLEPTLNNAATQGQVLKSVALSIGPNVVNHKLGRKLQGWCIVRKRASSDIYDTQDTNQTPELTLTLQASIAVVVDIYVY